MCFFFPFLLFFYLLEFSLVSGIFRHDRSVKRRVHVTLTSDEQLNASGLQLGDPVANQKLERERNLLGTHSVPDVRAPV